MRWRRRRRWFLARLGLAFVVVLTLSAYGLVALARTLAGTGSGSIAIGGPVWLAVPLLLLGFVAAMRLVGRPLGEVVGAAERVASGDFAVRVTAHGPPSLRSVASAFNSMIAVAVNCLDSDASRKLVPAPTGTRVSTAAIP